MKYLLERVIVSGRQTGEPLEIGAGHDERGDEVVVVGNGGPLARKRLGGRNLEPADDCGDPGFGA